MSEVFNIRRSINSDAALSVVAADEIFSKLVDHLEQGVQVEVDFEGIRNATTVFLNTAVGQLYGRFEPAYVDDHLSIVNANPLVSNMVRMTVKNAKLFYSADNPTHDDDQPIEEV